MQKWPINRELKIGVSMLTCAAQYGLFSWQIFQNCWVNNLTDLFLLIVQESNPVCIVLSFL